MNPDSNQQPTQAQLAGSVEIGYESPPTRHNRNGAAAVLVAGGLGLIFLGGCFLIGAMTGEYNDASIRFLAICYGLTVICAIGGLSLIVLAVRMLIRTYGS